MPTDLEKIAIVGMACRLPHAESVEEYWQNLLEVTFVRGKKGNGLMG